MPVLDAACEPLMSVLTSGARVPKVERLLPLTGAGVGLFASGGGAYPLFAAEVDEKSRYLDEKPWNCDGKSLKDVTPPPPPPPPLVPDTVLRCAVDRCSACSVLDRDGGFMIAAEEVDGRLLTLVLGGRTGGLSNVEA